MKYPNTRYASIDQLLYWKRGLSEKDLAKHLKRSKKTIENYLSGREKIPWWIPELLRLQHLEYEQRMCQMGIGRDKRRLGLLKENVIVFQWPKEKTRTHERILSSSEADLTLSAEYTNYATSGKQA